MGRVNAAAPTGGGVLSCDGLGWRSDQAAVTNQRQCP